MKRYTEKWSGCIFLWVCLVVMAVGCSKSYSDKNMQNHFIDNKQTFDGLIQMIKEDKTVSWINEESITPADSLKSERKAQYLELMRKANIQNIFIERRSNLSKATISEGQDISRVSFGMRISFFGTLKGYTYSTQPLSPIYDSLDQRPSSLKPYEFGYKRISDDWYLHYSDQG